MEKSCRIGSEIVEKSRWNHGEMRKSNLASSGLSHFCPLYTNLINAICQDRNFPTVSIKYRTNKTICILTNKIRKNCIFLQFSKKKKIKYSSPFRHNPVKDGLLKHVYNIGRVDITFIECVELKLGTKYEHEPLYISSI